MQFIYMNYIFYEIIDEKQKNLIVRANCEILIHSNLAVSNFISSLTNLLFL